MRPTPGNGQMNGGLRPPDSLVYFLVCRTRSGLSAAATGGGLRTH